jgi:hypothetical protein
MHLPTHVYIEQAAEQVYKAWEAHNAWQMRKFVYNGVAILIKDIYYE